MIEDHLTAWLNILKTTVSANVGNLSGNVQASSDSKAEHLWFQCKGEAIDSI